MALIPSIQRGNATAEQRRVGDIIFGSRNEAYGGPSAILLHIPELAERFDHLRNYLVREQKLPKRLMHLAALITARFWEASYAWWKRVPMCLEAGIPQEAIEAIADGRDPDFVDEDLAAVYDYVVKLFQTRQMDPASHRRLETAIGTDRLIELVLVVGFYSMLGLVCDAFQPDFPPGVSPPNFDSHIAGR